MDIQSSHAPSRWNLASSSEGILWNVADQSNPANTLPHADHLEMSGRRVSIIVRYRIDNRRQLFVERDIFWPQLRIREGDVRAYLHRIYDDRDILPRLTVNGNEWFPAWTPIETIRFDGILTFQYATSSLGITASRSIFPSRTQAGVVERWQLINSTDAPLQITLYPQQIDESYAGALGTYAIHTEVCQGDSPFELAPGEAVALLALFTADTPSFSPQYSLVHENVAQYESERHAFTHRIQTAPEHITLTCPDPVLNQAFAFAKLRAAESLFDTSLMGLVHSPGGGNYYGGIWANDQCEYASPFFAFLNDTDAKEASVNAYRHYYRAMQERPDYSPVPTSFEMEGTIPYSAGGDRGDAAMIASGLSRYLLTCADRELATEFYPSLQWCLEYCRRKTDERGIVLSDTDELENRFPAGDANLSTSSLAYDGYRRGADLARALGYTEEAADWDRRADTLRIAIEDHFGAIVEGFPTYRYYEENTTLRSWISLPLVFDIADGERKQGTIAALFSPQLWTPDGLATEAGDKVFWDRSALYGLRGAFRAGATEEAFSYLLEYSYRRLLGEHVPYPVEAYPENAQKHLSAESALYGRVFVEGLLGVVPTGFDTFTLTPRLPLAWSEYSLRFMAFGGRAINITISRGKVDTIRTVVTVDGALAHDATAVDGITYTIVLTQKN